ncbi:unnamed protein product [Caenorhabditis brenneri]
MRVRRNFNSCPEELFTPPRWLTIRMMKYRRFIVFPIVFVIITAIYLFKNRYMRNTKDFFMDNSYLKVSTEVPLPPLLPGVLDDPSRRLTRKLPVSHAFIVSAYYYPKSKSLGKNAVALNMVVDARNFEIDHSNYYIVGSNESHAQLSMASSQIQGVIPCRYAPTVALANTVGNMTKLEMQSAGIKVEIPFKMARYKAPKQVIICISPQFVAEQWQIFMMQVHVARRFGAHIHIYLTSIIDSYFELMKEYEKMGYITIDFWLRMKFAQTESPYFEPNINTELRNQAGAQTDCLLQYKEAAKYIAFFDLDDILFPTKHTTYLAEFNAEWKLQPNASSIYYLRKEHEFVKAQYLSEFSFYDIVSSLKSSDTLKRGKVVVKPRLHNSTWIHASQHETPDNRHTVEHTSIIHVQRPLQKNSENNMTRLWKIDFMSTKQKVEFRPKDLKLLEKDIWRIRNLTRIQEIAPNLPSADFYLPIVFQCYYDALYLESDVAKTGVKNCPNAELCEMPQREDYKCLHSDADYLSGPHMEPFTFHFSNNSFWNNEIGCYQ